MGVVPRQTAVADARTLPQEWGALLDGPSPSAAPATLMTSAGAASDDVTLQSLQRASAGSPRPRAIVPRACCGYPTWPRTPRWGRLADGRSSGRSARRPGWPPAGRRLRRSATRHTRPPTPALVTTRPPGPADANARRHVDHSAAVRGHATMERPQVQQVRRPPPAPGADWAPLTTRGPLAAYGACVRPAASSSCSGRAVKRRTSSCGRWWAPFKTSWTPSTAARQPRNRLLLLSLVRLAEPPTHAAPSRPGCAGNCPSASSCGL